MTTRTHGARIIAEELMRRIESGAVREGEYLSSVRALSTEFGCAPLTAHRALKQLAEKGLVVAEPRHGYRVTGPDRDEKAQGVVAFLEDTRGSLGYLGEIYETQLAVLRRGALARGWTSAVLPYEGQSPERIADQLAEIGATALILQDIGERFPPDLPAALMSTGLPAVSLDLACSAPGMDQVLRDEAHGAALAAEHLIARGHRQIGWYGPLTDSLNARRRFAGAAEILVREGLGESIRDWRGREPATETRVAREYLESAGPPAAVLVLWQTAATALARAARELGLTLGTDLDVVGWSLEEHFEKEYAVDCPQLRETCATVTWSMTDVGRLVFDRLEARRRVPDLPAARVLLPMRLRGPQGSSPKRTANRAGGRVGRR
jgi:DNA-binding LacI/PurR family transcriptional regulator